MMGIELEEGEALPRFSVFDENIDPDKDFSYIDKKIQDVLGQYQRDFMGEVSAENLGARFGGYGSFLPAYQHSSSTLTRARNQSHLSSRSPYNTPLEGASLYSVRTNNYLPRVVSSSNCNAVQSLSVRRSEGAGILSVTESLSTDSLKHRSPGGCVANKESRGLPRNKSIQNPLKFRVKVVSYSLLPRDNSAIYSGLGLDMSPSTSLEDIPSEVDEASPNMHEMPEGSPSCIIEIMTSFPVPAGKISPLHGSLLHLVEYQSKLGNGRAGPQQAVSLSAGHESALCQRKTEVNRQMNVRKKDNNVEVEQYQKENNKGQTNVSCPSLISGVKKETVSTLSELAVPMDKLSASGHSFVCNGKDEVNGKSLKHQLATKDKGKKLGPDSVSVLETDLKDRKGTIGVGVAAKNGMDSSVPINDAILNKVNEDSSLDSIKSLSQRGLLLQYRREKLLDSVTFQDSDVSNERQSNRTEKVSKSKKVNFSLRRDAEDGGEVCKVNHDVTQGIKDHNSKPFESSIENLDLKGVHSFKKEALPKGKEYSSSLGRKKSKKSRNDDRLAAELSNSPSGLSSFPAQAEPPTLRIKFPSKGGTDDLKPGKELRNLKDALNEMHSETDIKKKERIKDPKNCVQGTLMGGTRPSNDKVKVKPGEKVVEHPFKPGPNLKDDQSMSNPSTEITFTSGALQTLNAYEADNWVQCDKCQKWRLLPNGLLPACLPNKWICRMLDWLPGMNKCSFSEDDTTNALLAQYHIPASVPEKHNIRPDFSKGGVPMTASVALQRGVALGHLSTLKTSSGVKNGHVQQLQKYAENDQQYSLELGNPKKSSQPAVYFNSVQGNVEAKPCKKEKKREEDEDLSGVTKKVKRVQQQSKKEQSPAGMVSKGSRDGQNRSTNSSEVSKEFLLDSSSTSVKKIKDTVHGMINTVRSEVNDDSGKKRKLANELNSKSYTESSDWKEQISMDNQAVENEALKTEVNGGSERVGERNKNRSKGLELHKKEHFTKREDAKVNPSRCKDAAAGDMSVVQCHVDDISHKSLEVRKSSKRDKELVSPSAASNSSKLSGPCKVKVKHRERKSSPAGSISCSPFKVSRDHDSSGNKVSDLHNEPEDLLSVKRQNSGPLDEIIRSVKSSVPWNSVTKYDYDDEDLFAKTVGQHKQSSSVKHHVEHGIVRGPTARSFDTRCLLQRRRALHCLATSRQKFQR